MVPTLDTGNAATTNHFTSQDGQEAQDGSEIVGTKISLICIQSLKLFYIGEKYLVQANNVKKI